MDFYFPNSYENNVARMTRRAATARGGADESLREETCALSLSSDVYLEESDAAREGEGGER